MDVGLSCINHFGESICAHYQLVDWVRQRNHEKAIKLQRAISQSTCASVLLSCENFYHHWSPDDIAFLASYLSEFDVEIICYVRPQDDYMESAWKQQAKIGELRMPFPHFLERHTHPKFLNDTHANYYRMLAPWSTVFGRQAICLRVFNADEFVDGQLLFDFLKSCGIDVANMSRSLRLSVSAAASNRALPSELAELIRRVNVTGQVNKKELPQLVSYLSALREYKNIPLLSASDRVRILQNYGDSNKALFEEYRGSVMPDCFQFKEAALSPSSVGRFEDLGTKSLISAWRANPDFVPLGSYKSLKNILSASLSQQYRRLISTFRRV